jgi:hypothetical protein
MANCPAYLSLAYTFQIVRCMAEKKALNICIKRCRRDDAFIFTLQHNSMLRNLQSLLELIPRKWPAFVPRSLNSIELDGFSDQIENGIN